VEIPFSDRYAIGKYNLRPSQTVTLSGQHIDTLKTYLKYERVSPDVSKDEPLFTTQRGRLSLSHLRRSVRETSETVLSQANKTADSEQSEKQHSVSQHVTPEMLWQYGLVQSVTAQ
jgi:hypothetical protein